MVVEQFPNFVDWIGSAAGPFGLILVAATLLGIFFGYVVTSFRHGPFEAFYVVAQVVGGAIPDFLGTSLRRVLAMAGLAIKEALRRKVVLATFGIFAAALLFGGWFMNSGSDHPDRIYVNFVLWGTQLLVLLMGLLISAFSLPDDIKNKTIYTIVTKPVRPTEIILGRIVGFGALTTGLLAIMAVISYFFVWGGLSHQHQLVGQQDMSAFVDVDQDSELTPDMVASSQKLSVTGRRASKNAEMEAQTTTDDGHFHRIELVRDVRDADNPPADMSNVVSQEKQDDGRIVYRRLFCKPASGHTHKVTIDSAGKIQIGPAVGFFRARIPIYSDRLSFLDRQGNQKDRGIDVGREWRYRGYVDGGSLLAQTSLSKAMFDFENFTEDRFSADQDVLPLEMTLSVFRTFKGDIEQRVIGSLQFESVPDNPDADYRIQSEPIVFETNEYSLQVLPIPRKIVGRKIAPDGKLLDQGLYDIFTEYASNGKLRLNLRCEDRSQYIGVARADVYFRANDDVYWVNFVKGYVGIWCQMMIVIAMGVAFSTFLSAPITMLATVVMLILGFFSTFIRTMTAPEVAGGGPIESFYRIITQKNMTTDLETGVATTLMEQSDYLIVQLLNSLTYLAPNFGQLNFAEFLTYGYSIDIHRLLVAVTIAIAFCLGLSILGYFSLKTREIAK